MISYTRSAAQTGNYAPSSLFGEARSLDFYARRSRRLILMRYYCIAGGFPRGVFASAVTGVRLVPVRRGRYGGCGS